MRVSQVRTASSSRQQPNKLQLYVYPIKSLRPTTLTEGVVTRRGFPYDRHFMLLKVQQNEDGTESLQNMQVPCFPEMSLFLTNMVFPSEHQAGKVIVAYRPPGVGDAQVKILEVPLQPDVQNLKKLDIDLHSSPTEGYDMGSHYNDWFSGCFGYPVVLAYLGGNSRRVLGSFAPSLSLAQREQSPSSPVSPWLKLVLPALSLVYNLIDARGVGMKVLFSIFLILLSIWLGYWQSTSARILSFLLWRRTQDEGENITFADCSAYLVVSETSLHNVSARLAGDEEMDITKFRPNIVIEGAENAFEEDFWAELTVGKSRARILLTANCVRCRSINVDFATGKMGTGDGGSVLKKLMGDRRVDKGAKYAPVFGRYSFIAQDSENESIRVGDEVVLSRTASERTVYGEFS